jgi:hypothetical protein
LFFLVETDPAVAVAVTGSPGNTAGGVACADSVIGGCFLHPTGKREKPTATKTRQKVFISREYMCDSPS